MNFRRLAVLAVTLVIGSMFVIPASANEKSEKTQYPYHLG